MEMNKVMSEELKHSLMKDSMELLKEYDYLVRENSLLKILNTAWEQKQELRELFRKSPLWDEDQQAIIFTESYQAGVNVEGVQAFSNWVSSHLLDNFMAKFGVFFDEQRFAEVRGIYRAMGNILDSFSQRRLGANVVLACMERRYEVEEEYNKLMNELSDISSSMYQYNGDGKKIFLTKNDERLYNKILYVIENSNLTIATDEYIEMVNGLNLDIKCAVGEKVSKIVQKICKKFELDKVVEMQEFTNPTTHQVRVKDMGWNYQYPAFADAINPVSIKKYTVISINPLDYWTMSFLKDTSSCHTIDKTNKRNVPDRDHVYGGMYSSGTESYMLDKTSVVFYTVDESHQGPMWKATKDRRIMFHLDVNQKAFVFGRLYPDGRDKGDTGMAAQFRLTFQKIVSDLIGETNMWITKRNSEVNARRYTETNGTHYCDYTHYDDCGVSVLKTSNKIVNGKIGDVCIKIGHNPICPTCGREHTHADAIMCSYCWDHRSQFKECGHCGGVINPYDDGVIFCRDNLTYYCCAGCAEQAGIVRCFDDNNWHEKSICYYDECLGKYFYSDTNMIVVDDKYYFNESTAKIGGCIYDEERHIWTRTVA